jgi:L-gulono-1,4-lactone dehydrogenase
LLRRSRRHVTAFTNWAGNQHCRPSHVHFPRSEEDIAEILDLAAKQKVSAKVVGSGHSWSDAACTDGHMLRLDEMNGVLDIDRKAGCVTVEAGMRLCELNEQLARHGLALGNLGSISEQTIAGAISTGTHGTGVRFGSLSTFVRSLRLMRADGSVMELSRADGDAFEAARLSLGCLGVLTRITLRCEPAFDLEEKSFTLSFDDALDRMLSLVDDHDHVKFWWLPHTDSVFVVTARRIPLTETTRRRRVRNVFAGAAETMANRGVFAALMRAGALAPSVVPSINRAVDQVYFRSRRRVDRSDRVFNLPMPPTHREMEYGIPRDVAPLALRRLRELTHTLRIVVNFVVEVRFVAHDSILLSPSFGRNSCQLGAYIGEHPHLPIYFDAFETLCRQLNGRPHWGKEFQASADDLHQRIPGIGRFLSVRRALDPNKRFDNRFARRVFGAG